MTEFNILGKSIEECIGLVGHVINRRSYNRMLEEFTLQGDPRQISVVPINNKVSRFTVCFRRQPSTQEVLSLLQAYTNETRWKVNVQKEFSITEHFPEVVTELSSHLFFTNPNKDIFAACAYNPLNGELPYCVTVLLGTFTETLQSLERQAEARHLLNSPQPRRDKPSIWYALLSLPSLGTPTAVTTKHVVWGFVPFIAFLLFAPDLLIWNNGISWILGILLFPIFLLGGVLSAQLFYRHHPRNQLDPYCIRAWWALFGGAAATPICLIFRPLAAHYAFIMFCFGLGPVLGYRIYRNVTDTAPNTKRATK
jgi:hypothetical protein